MKGAGIFGDELHYKMATYYYQMGDILLEKVENSGDVFAGPLGDIGNKGEPKEGMIPNDEEKMCEKGQDDMDKGNAELNEAQKAHDDQADDVQASFENIETARYILQKELEKGGQTDESKRNILKKIAWCH